MCLLALWGLLVFSLHVPSSCFGFAATDTLSRRDALAGDERLVSSNGKFALGFFQTGSKSYNNNTVNSYLGIWFNRVSKLTPVWTANGENPTSTLSSPKLVIASDGNLVVLAKDTIIWSTQANITSDNDNVAVLSSQGNLVLRSSSNASNIFWQSFDYPTDTLLVGAKLGQNKITGMVRRIVSRKNLLDQSPGAYSNELGTDGVMRLSWKSSTLYWSSRKWNGRFFNSIPSMSGNSLCNHTLVNNDREVYFTDTLFNESTILHVFIDVSGQWKIRIWDAHDWVTFTYEPANGCDVYAVCGAFTTCSSGAKPICHCMKGFSIRSPADWQLEDRTGGCIRNTHLDCHTSEKNRTHTTDKFYSMLVTRLPQNGRGMPNATSAQACAQVCSSNCSCTAYSYGKGGCSVWHSELINVVVDDSGEILYLRLAEKELEILKSNRNEIVIGLIVGISTIVFTLIVLMVILGTRIWSSQAMDNDHGNIGIIVFSYVDIKYATRHFSEKLGGGGFGSVFKGHLSNSVVVAVKRLEGPSQGENQFRAEVGSIGIIHHINLVKLIGFCCEGDRRILVYEHIANGSLDAHLFKSHGTVLDWNTRYHIALGVARGLAYLHHNCQECIIHCDIKPQNILLNKSFIPKIADFGMAKFLGRDFSRALTTIRGTIGYLAPEWISGTTITSKVDVYSYGMLLLDIISGTRSCKECFSDDDNTLYFPVKVANKLLLGGDVGTLVDEKLNGHVNREEVERVCRVACWCIQDHEFDRPTMVEVVQFLEGILEPNTPPLPRFLHAIAGGSSESVIQQI